MDISHSSDTLASPSTHSSSSKSGSTKLTRSVENDPDLTKDNVAMQSMTDATKRTCRTRFYKKKTKVLLTALAVLVFVFSMAGYLIIRSDYNAALLDPPDPVEPQKPSASRLYVFQKAAVCTEATQCSEIGKQILIKNGSAVDAAIGAMFCNGLLNQQNLGLGGGFFMTVYIKDEAKAYTVIAREKAPAKATYDMYSADQMKSFLGPQAVAVPGELRGMWEAHKRWGKLPWESLISPTLDIFDKGFILSKFQHAALAAASKEDMRFKTDKNIM